MHQCNASALTLPLDVKCACLPIVCNLSCIRIWHLQAHGFKMLTSGCIVSASIALMSTAHAELRMWPHRLLAAMQRSAYSTVGKRLAYTPGKQQHPGTKVIHDWYFNSPIYKRQRVILCPAHVHACDNVLLEQVCNSTTLHNTPMGQCNRRQLSSSCTSKQQRSRASNYAKCNHKRQPQVAACSMLGAVTMTWFALLLVLAADRPSARLAVATHMHLKKNALVQAHAGKIH